MKRTLIAAAALFIAGPALLSSTGSALAACETETKKDDLTTEQVQALYECIRDELRAGYAKADDKRTSDYTGWKAAATAPAAPGAHGNRFLMTFVNETGYAEYVKYDEERTTPMPVGTELAKESFNVSKKGKVRKGPLFFMTKVAAGEADEFGNWVYAAWSPKGKAMKIKQKFCHDCHGAFDEQDAMGYPDEDVRLTSN